MMEWLLENSVLNAIKAPYALTEAQITEASVAIGSPIGNADRIMTVSGDTATIIIAGVMTSSPSYMAYFFGGGNTLFCDIEAAIKAAESNPAIKNVDFYYNTGGGEAQPVAAIGDMIADMTKNTRSIVKTCASAGYWLASQSKTIVAEGKASQVGSLGIVATVAKPSESNTIQITSTNAPNKRPDPETEEGRAIIRAEIDPLHDLFATAVAMGRNVTIEKVNADFGKGGMMLATQAISAGMIDGMLNKQPSKKPKTTVNKENKAMNLKELQAEYPALFAEVKAVGHSEGVTAEQDRVKYHSLMGKKTGAISFALDACLNGTSMTDVEANVEYATHQRNGADLGNREKDEADLGDNSPASVDKGTREAALIASVENEALLACGLEGVK